MLGCSLPLFIYLLFPPRNKQTKKKQTKMINEETAEYRSVNSMISSGVEEKKAAGKATEILIQLCCDRSNEKEEQPSDVEVVRRCVKDGADVCQIVPRRGKSIIQYFLLHRKTNCVSACLETSARIDFTVTDGEEGNSVLQAACHTRYSDEETGLLIGKMVERIETHPLDVVDFSQMNTDGSDLVSLAAALHKLSVVWPIVKRQPHFDDRLDPLRLSWRVWRSDWELLDEDERKNFSLEGTEIVDVNWGTACLVKRLWEQGWIPNAEEVERLVCEYKADVNYREPCMLHPIVHCYMQRGGVEVVRAILKTPSTINFEATSVLGMPLLHVLLKNWNTPGKGKELLPVVLERFSSHPDEEETGWSARSRSGENFLSYAAKCGLLSAVWPILKSHRVEFYVRPNQVLPITVPVKRCDWNRLQDSDKQIFSFASIEIEG